MEKCFIEGCQKKIFFKCSCVENLYMCIDHNGLHMLKEGMHTLTRYTFISTGFKIDSHLNKFKEIIAAYNLIINNTRVFCNSVIENLNFSTAKLFKEITELKCLVKIVMKNLLLKTEFQYSDLVKFNSIKIPDINSCKLDSSLVNKSLKNAINNTIETITIYKKFDKYALFFQNKKDSIILQINLENLKRYHIKLSSDIFEAGTTCCKIGHDMYFFYGGFSFNKVPFLFNIDTRNITELKENVPISCAGACCFNDKVYIFGGTTAKNQFSSNSYKLNIKKNKWSNLQSLPANSEYTTSSSYCSRILVVGRNINSVLEYNPIKNYFRDFIELKTEGARYIFDNYVIIENNFLYEIENNELIKKREIKFTFGYLNNYSSYRRGNYIYFMCSNFDLYRIDSILKTLVKVNYLVAL